MKKILSIFVLCFALVCANAQIVIFHEGFEGGVIPAGWTAIDNDGDGFNWNVYTSSEGALMKTVDGVGCVGSLSYDNDTYSALTPDNYLITPAIQLTEDAVLHFFVAGQDDSYAAEHFSVYVSTTGTSVSDFTTVLTSGVSTANYVEYTCNLSAYTGQTVYIAFRHHNSTDQYMLLMDEVSVTQAPTDPSIFAPEDLDFGTVTVGNNATKTAQINAYHLTSGVVATTADPFTVSADGTTFGSTATLANNGGTLYVKFTPTAVADYNEVVTLSNESVNDVIINVSGAGFECSAIELPFATDFTEESVNNCWAIVDVNGDGDINGQGKFNLDAANGVAVYYVSATDTSNPANDWLISPEFTLGEATLLSYNYLNYFDMMYYIFYGMSFPEKYAVYVIPSDTDYTGAVEILPEQEIETFGSWTPAQLDLSEFEGQTLRIGFKVTTDPANGYYFAITNFAIGTAEPTIMTSADEGIDFATGIAGESNEIMPVLVYSLNINEDINIETNDPFSVSLDGTNFSTTALLPAETGLIAYDTIYVKYSPSTAGDFSDYVVLSTSEVTDTIAVSGSAVECNAIDEFPFAESFTDLSETVYCWQKIDANNDGKTFRIDGDGKAYYQYSSSSPADDWLISPEFVLDANQYLSFNAFVSNVSYPERFHVDIIDENGVHATLLDTTDIATTTPQNYLLDLTSYTGSYRIGFHCISDADMYMFNISDFSIEVVTPAIYLSEDTMSFVGAINVPTAAQNVAMTIVSIDEPIVATVAAPFEISSDNVNFSNTLTITATQTIQFVDVFVRYNPTVVGDNNETLTFTAGNVNATVILNGHAVDCSVPTLPYETNFSNEDLNTCWTIIDANGDGDGLYGEITFYTGADESYMMYAYNETNAADDWAISPAFTLGQNAAASFEYAVYNSNYPEKFSVYVIGEGQTYAEGTKVVNTKTVTNTNWAFQAVDLSAYNGQTVQVAIHVESAADKYAIFFTNFRIANDEVSIAEVSENDNNVSVYPNPANNVLNVNATSNISSVEVYTIAGQKVAGFTADGMQTVVNTSNLSNGMYIIKINTENGVVNQKFTVVR